GCAVVSAYQRRDEGWGERADLSARVVEREGGYVELAVGHRIPLVVGLEQRRTGIDLHFEAGIGGLGVARDDLDHFVAGVALAARKLVRGLEHRLGMACGGDRAKGGGRSK